MPLFSKDQVLFLPADDVYGADELGLPYRDIVGEGIVGSGDFAVSQRALGANMSVDVAPGAAWVKGDDDAAKQPTYRFREPLTNNYAIAASDPTNPRKDIAIIEILDSTFSGASILGRVRIITGTPAPVPSEPAVPNNAIKIATISVAAGAVSITNANITDRRTRARVGGGSAALGNGELYHANVSGGTAPYTMVDFGTLNFDGGEVEFLYSAPFIELPSGAQAQVQLYDAITGSDVSVTRTTFWKNTTVELWLPVYLKFRLTPAAGQHHYKLKLEVASGPAAIIAGIDSINPLAILRRV